MIDGLEAERLEGQMFNGFQEIGAALEKDFFVATVEVGEDFRVVLGAGFVGRDDAHVNFQVEPSGTDDAFQEMA